MGKETIKESAAIAVASILLSFPAMAAKAPSATSATATRTSSSVVVVTASASALADGFDVSLSAATNFKKATTLRLRATKGKKKTTKTAKSGTKAAIVKTTWRSSPSGTKAGVESVVTKSGSTTKGKLKKGTWKKTGIVSSAKATKFEWTKKKATFSVRIKTKKAKYARVRFLVGEKKGKWSKKVKIAGVSKAGGSGSTKAVKASSESKSTSGSSAKATTAKAASSEKANAAKLSKKERAAQAAIMAMKKVIPDGSPYSDDASTKYYWNGGSFPYDFGTGCFSFAARLSDAAFGKAVAKKRTGKKAMLNVKVGDFVRIDGDRHFVIVIDRDDDGVTVAEGNYDGKARWGRKISYDALVKIGDYVVTRY